MAFYFGDKKIVFQTSLNLVKLVSKDGFEISDKNNI
jgi:hypothetical protein